MNDRRRAHLGGLARAFRAGCAWLTAFVRLLLVTGVLATSAFAQGQAAPGQVIGRVFDSESGAPLQGVTVIVLWPAPADGGEPRQEVGVSDADGAFAFPAIPAGSYRIHFVKSGYRSSSIASFAVEPGQLNRADFPLPPLPPETSSEVLDLEEFAVEASTVDEMMASLELRMDADQLVNVMSAEDLSKFAATDVGDALKRVAGVNIVEGQFAIIRGLEDRYSSTLYNSAPVPSPDPDRQSVQLDLFPAEVVDNLVVSKTAAPELPSNSAGGSIDIVTHGYPQDFTFSLKGAGGFNENAVFDRFLEFEKGSPIGEDWKGAGPFDSEAGAFLGGRAELFGRELRYKALGNWELSYETLEGVTEGREPRKALLRRTQVIRSGDLSLGQLNLSDGRFDLTESEREEQSTGYGGFGFDVDETGNHKIDASLFYTKKQEDAVQLEENGYLPNFDYGVLAQKQSNGDEINPNADFDGFATLTSWIVRSVRGSANDAPSRGPLWYASFFESESFERSRDLLISQLNGDHQIAPIEGLHLSWAANYAKTTEEQEALGARYFYEPDDTDQIPTRFPTTPDVLGPGSFVANAGLFSSSNDIDEKQHFGRIDADYERSLSEVVTVTATGGGWFERATRNVDSSFLENPSLGGSSQFAILADTPQALGAVIFDSLDRSADGDLSGLRDTENESTREVTAGSVGAKATFWERLDLLGGVRFESIFIESLNQPFTGDLALDGSPAIFPSKYLFFDRLDNPARREVIAPPPPGTTFNDQLLGIDVPIDPVTGLVDLVDEAAIADLINGEIDEDLVLPSVNLAYRPIEGLTLRGAWSQTVARPSFREMGYYVSVEPGTDDLIVGNPQLELSHVDSWDLRSEYVWGGFGDLVAVSGFIKRIADPIESIVVRNPLNFEGSSSALFRTFFNNPNEASLWGIEAEVRKNLGFLGPDFAEYFSVGGNYTYIKAEVDRIDAELARSAPFFGVAAGDVGEFSSLEGSRRLFGQPEWIANADFTFDHPGWGSKLTLAFFAISDVLDAAGSAAIGPNGTVQSFVPDRYIAAFHQLDLIASQTWTVDLLRGDLTLKISAKNLTDSTRKIVYDPDQTSGEIPERSYKKGREFKLSFTYSF